MSKRGSNSELFAHENDALTARPQSDDSVDESGDSGDDSSANDSSTENEENGVNNENEKQQQEESVSKLPDAQLVPLNFEDLDLNSWVLVLYEEERFLGRLLTKGGWPI